MVTTMTSPEVVSFHAIEAGWSVEGVLDTIIQAANDSLCSALIDTGALITGFTNREVAEYLLGFGKVRRGELAKRPALKEDIEGVVFLDDDGGKKILLRQTREATKLADSGVPAQKRFAFYDQVHTTGMDIQHKLDAIAALTLGKDMTWRDYVQGAYRMRGIGRGQQICLYVIPEVVELIEKDLKLADIEKQLGQGAQDNRWTLSVKGRLLAVAAWLLVNSIRTERIQFAMLQLQNLNNIWRRNAFAQIMRDFEVVTSEGLRSTVTTFKETIAFTVPAGVPRPRGVHEVVEERISEVGAFITTEDDKAGIAEIRANVRMVADLGDNKEDEAGLDTEQQREQEQERQQEQEQEEEREQEVEIEKFVDLMHCRDDEEPESWNLNTLAEETKAKQFYGARQFRLWKRKPLSSLAPESSLSRNWFNPQWSGFRRVKNVFVQMEWTPSAAQAMRSLEPLHLDDSEEKEMHQKLRSVWALLTRSPGEAGEEIQPPAVTVTSDGKKILESPPGEINADQLREVLAASFDWEPALHDPSAALASLKKRKDETLTYDETVQLLRDGRFRTRDDGRIFVILSLAEAETLRRALHVRIGAPLLGEAGPQAALALRCVFANHQILDASAGFHQGPTFQVRMLHQVARFLDGQTFYKPQELTVLLRALQHDRPFDRRRFLEGLSGCRRRAGLAHWESQPIAEVLRPWLEFEQVLARIRAVRLRAAISGQGMSVQMAFQRYDSNSSGLLEPMEFCKALRELGFAFSAEEVANWIEAIDANSDYCIDYSEFFAFCKLQVDAILGASPVADTREVLSSVTKRSRGVKAARDGADADTGDQSVNDGKNVPADAPPKPELAPALERATSKIVRPEDIEDELFARRAAVKQAEAQEERAKADVEETIDVLIEEELGMNPCYGEGFGEWDFRGQLLPKDSFALGIVDILPESWGARKGSNYLHLDLKAGLVLQRMQLAPNGESDRRLNRYSLTIWFRTISLPSKADRMLLIDLPRGEVEAGGGDDNQKGALFIWRGGIIAPEGYSEPAQQRRKRNNSRSGVGTVAGEWQLKFKDDDAQEKVSSVMMTTDVSGRLRVEPCRGAAARRKGDSSSETIFAIKIKLQHEKRQIIEQGRVTNPSNSDEWFNILWNETICRVFNPMLNKVGNSWKKLGFVRGRNHCEFKMRQDFKSGPAEGIVARNLDISTAVRLLKELTGLTKEGFEIVEDRSFQSDINIGDKVRLRAGGSEYDFLKPGMIGKVTHMDESTYPLLARSEDECYCNWYQEKDLEKATPVEARQMTDVEWMLAPSTRQNYVSFSQQKPNPLLESKGWSARGRADRGPSGTEAKLALDVSADGCLSAYVDAEVCYVEGALQLGGTWKSADGKHGTVTGTKSLQGISLGGIWHVELQEGGDPMGHAWNMWLSCFQMGDKLAMRLTGSALAGPLLDSNDSTSTGSPPRIDVQGEISGDGTMNLSFSADSSGGRWAGSTWEGELCSDRWLRGSWKCAQIEGAPPSAGGRWRARCVGRKVVSGTIRPIAVDGMLWEERQSVATVALDSSSNTDAGRIAVGQKVRLVKNQRKLGDALSGPMKHGDIGELTYDDRSTVPYQVRCKDCYWWYTKEQIRQVKADGEETSLQNPLGEEFEGFAFHRFPITKGDWYAEVKVEKLGQTAPLVGWAVCVSESSKIELVRMAVIDGTGMRKLDISKKDKKTETGGKDGEDKAAKDGEEKADGGEEKVEGKEDEGAKEGEEAAEEGKEAAEEGNEAAEEGAEAAEEGKEAAEEGEEEATDPWDRSQPYGDSFQTGDTICCKISMPGGKIAFGLNGDFSNPMGDAFNLELPEGAEVILVLAPGDSGKLKVNMGHAPFLTPPPEGNERGLGEAMRLRPTWQVDLPKEVKAWPVYAAPSRSAEGKKALKSEEIVEEFSVQGDWLLHEGGWSQCKAVAAGKQYEALKPTPTWKVLDRPEKPKKAKKSSMKRIIQASFDTEFSAEHNWSFKGIDTATCSNGPTSLISLETTSTGVLKWCFKNEEGNQAFEVGVIPAREKENVAYLHETGECGLKNKATSDGDQLTPWDMYQQYIEVTADMAEKKATFRVGAERDKMAEVKKVDIPYEEEIHLVIIGWNNTNVHLEPPRIDAKKDDESSSSDEEEDQDGLVVLGGGNSVQSNTWHVATIVADLPAGKLNITLDGEQHLLVSDRAGLLPDGPLSIDPREGLILFGSTRRSGGLVGELDWRAGGQLRSLRIDDKPLSQVETWAEQLPKGIWACRCGTRNAADARLCWRCRSSRVKSAPRPPGDVDPRNEGLTVVTADSFRELVLESPRHVFIMASAPWCGACVALKALWCQLAKVTSADNDIAVAIVDVDENELPTRYFPETYIPNVKLFLRGKKRQPIVFPHAGRASFETIALFLEEKAGISIRESVEKGYPQYAETVGVDAFMQTLVEAATEAPLRRSPGNTGMQTLAAFFHGFLLDTSFRRSLLEDPMLPPVGLQRFSSASVGPGPGPSLTRSKSVPANSDIMTLDIPLVQRLCTELLEKHFLPLLRRSQPGDLPTFASNFFLQLCRPRFQHRNFYNARKRRSWQVTPAATKIVAAARLLRFILRCAKRRNIDLGLQSWAPSVVTTMTPAALRHNWRRMEAAIGAVVQQRALGDLQQLVDRGYHVDGAPFGTTPLLLAAAVGNLPAAQYLFVHGANVHLFGGRPAALPIEVAAYYGHQRVVELLAENGSVHGRALHYAAYSGAADVCMYLIRSGSSPDRCVEGLPVVAVALVAGQHRLAEQLLEHSKQDWREPLQAAGCRRVALAEGSTLLHLAASLGGLHEGIVLKLVRNLTEEALEDKNEAGESAFDLMSPTLKAVIRASHFSLFKALASVETPVERAAAVTTTLKEAGSQLAAVVDLRGFSPLDVACIAGEKEVIDVLLSAGAPVVARGPTLPSALMWAHWRAHEEAVISLTANGASLSNADLEGLQRLRAALHDSALPSPPPVNKVEDKRASQTSKGEKGKEVASVSAENEASGGEREAMAALMKPTSNLWVLNVPSTEGYMATAGGLVSRMAWGVGVPVGIVAGRVDDTKVPPSPAEFREALGHCASEISLVQAQLFALRRVAEGSGLVLVDLIALRLFITDDGFHRSCSAAFLTVASAQPAQEDANKAADIYGAHARLAHALLAVPAKKCVCYRVCQLPREQGSTLREFLRGNRHGLDNYRPGSVVLWRNAASATTDGGLAEEVAMRGSGLSVVFKVRRVVGARSLSEFAEYPTHGEVVFPPCSAFRVVALFPCTEKSIRRGVGSEGGLFSVDLGSTQVQHTESLSWEEACKSRAVVVLLDEEEPGVIHAEETPI
eukprot:TRINITY_DN30381_c0_g2_i1.p1 TRINITY_DN30381_c0_g2~~TRINITY_DN30381_c0_g2_i1.p1  ORF type:complete len:3775 (-),score=772.57 TRINITY_DN30381_c0_g2_i1:67-10008(-)